MALLYLLAVALCLYGLKVCNDRDWVIGGSLCGCGAFFFTALTIQRLMEIGHA